LFLFKRDKVYEPVVITLKTILLGTYSADRLLFLFKRDRVYEPVVITLKTSYSCTPPICDQAEAYLLEGKLQESPGRHR
jgi:hypothetical protein